MTTPTSSRRPLEKFVIALDWTDDLVEKIRSEHPEITIEHVKESPTAADLADADGVMIGWVADNALIENAPRLQWVQTGGAGVERFPLGLFARRGIVLTNCSGVHVPNIPEHILAMVLAFARGFPWLLRAQYAGRWFDAHGGESLTTFELAGQSVLLVGMGDIGLGFGERAAALGMRICGVRRDTGHDAPDFVEQVYGMDLMGEVLPRIDHVVNSLPLTGETAGIFDAAMISRMKDGAYFYNVGRGGTVDTAALIDALGSGRLGGAGLDVTEPEPLPEDSPLFTLANVILTAHSAGLTPRYDERAAAILSKNLTLWQTGQPLVNQVNLQLGY